MHGATDIISKIAFPNKNLPCLTWEQGHSMANSKRFCFSKQIKKVIKMLNDTYHLDREVLTIPVTCAFKDKKDYKVCNAKVTNPLADICNNMR